MRCENRDTGPPPLPLPTPRSTSSPRGGCRCSAVYFVVGGSRARAGWLVGNKNRVASHESTIVQIITSPCGGLLRRSIFEHLAATAPPRKASFTAGFAFVRSIVDDVLLAPKDFVRRFVDRLVLDSRTDSKEKIEPSLATDRNNAWPVAVCAYLYSPYRIPIKSNGAGSHRTVKATDAAPATFAAVAAAIVLLSVERCPPTTHDLGPVSLPVLNPAHCFSPVMRARGLFASDSKPPG